MVKKKVYEPPTVAVFDADEIVNLLGPAQASSSSDFEPAPFQSSLKTNCGSGGRTSFGR